VRIWDVDVRLLCDRHLLGEHRELHAIWTVQTEGKRGYGRHPETLRWRGRLAALYARHEAQVGEMARRGFRHASPLDRVHATGETTQTEFVDSLDVQIDRLAQLGCNCVCSRAAGGGVRSGNPSDDAVNCAIRVQDRK
jgi:Pyrimidine dimer DNA glycosylase